MAANLILSFNVVMPLCLEMALGYLLKKTGLIDKSVSAALNKLIFRCFLPILLFYNIYQTDIQDISDVSYLVYAAAAVIVLFVLLMVIIPRIEHDNRRAGVLIQAGFRSNIVLFGMPAATLLLGEGNTGAVALLIAVIVPLFNVLAVIDLEFFRGHTVDVKALVRGIVTNPLIIGTVIGLVVNFGGLSLPLCVENAVSSVSKTATPLSLIVLGAAFELDAVKDCWRQLFAGVSLRLVFAPAVMLLVAACMGIRGDRFVGLLMGFASPAAVNSYVMAEAMGGDGVLASQIVFYSTLLSILTMFVFIFVTKTVGMF